MLSIVAFSALIVHAAPLSSQVAGYTVFAILYALFFIGSTRLTKFLFDKRLARLDMRPFVEVRKPEQEVSDHAQLCLCPVTHTVRTASN